MKPSEIKEFYQRLGVSETASEQELKQAYRSLAQQWHPDHNPGRESESRIEFIAVSEAYRGLSERINPEIQKPTTRDNSYEFYNNFYQDFLRTIEQVSPELAAATRLFCGNSMPIGMEALFRDFFGK
jgi:hypothetical protein